MTRVGISNQHLTSYKSSGIFVSEVSGLYHISVVIMAYTSGARVVITRNNRELIKGHINSYYRDGARFRGRLQSNAAIVVTELQKGDRIDIKPLYDMNINGNNISCLTIQL